MRREEEGGKVVAVLEKRAVDARREGYFIVQVSREPGRRKVSYGLGFLFTSLAVCIVH